MTNVRIPPKKTSKKDLLSLPKTTFINRFQKVYIRFLSFGRDTKIALNISLPKNSKIDPNTGIVEGCAEITQQILTYSQRFETGFRRSIIEGREPSVDWLKIEMFGLNHARLIPKLLIILEKYYAHDYGEKSKMDEKTKEKNGYSMGYLIEWIEIKLGRKAEVSEVLPIHAEMLLFFVMTSKKVSKEHARRTVGFLDRALKFSVKSGWLTNNPFQYTLQDKVFSRRKREITNYLTPEELEKIEQAEIHVTELAKIRDWFVLACHIGFEWHNFYQFKKSWISKEKDGSPYLEGNRCKEIDGFGEHFIVPLNSKANTLVCKFLAESDPNSDLLFQNMPSNTFVNRLLKQVEILAGVNRKLSFNYSRKTFATNGINAGVRAEVLQKMTGHSDIKTLLDFYAEIKKSTILQEGKF